MNEPAKKNKTDDRIVGMNLDTLLDANILINIINEKATKTIIKLYKVPNWKNFSAIIPRLNNTASFTNG